MTLFYRAVHGGIASNDTKVLETLVKYTGPRLFSLNLPGASLLILDYIHAANIILAGQDLNAPRTEAVSILGSLLTLPATMAKLPVLQPTNNNDIATMPCPDAKEHIITILLRSCRREPSGIARSVALSSVAMFAYRELSHDTRHSRIPEAITVLLQALRVSIPIGAQKSLKNCINLRFALYHNEHDNFLYLDFPNLRFAQKSSTTRSINFIRRKNNENCQKKTFACMQSLMTFYFYYIRPRNNKTI